MNKQIAVITVLYNSEDVVDEFLESLARQASTSLRLYAIDNSPSSSCLERTRSAVNRLGLDAKLVYNNDNAGFAKGCNQGIRLALLDGCDYILLANNDTVFGPDTLRALAQPLNEGELISCPKILYAGPERRIWFAGGRIDAWTMRTPHIGMMEHDRGQHDNASYTGFATGCFVMIHPSVFEKVGLLDERFFVYYEDADFAWRLNRAGVRMRYTPSAVIEHKVSTLTGGKLSAFTQYYSNRNRIFFIRKNFRGLLRWVALSYVLASRLVQGASLPRTLAASFWGGVRDGLCQPMGHHAD